MESPCEGLSVVYFQKVCHGPLATVRVQLPNLESTRHLPQFFWPWHLRNQYQNDLLGLNIIPGHTLSTR